MSEGITPHPGLTRRSFLKTTGALAGTATVGGGLASLVSKEAALADNAPSGETKTVVGACMRAGCFACQHNIDVRDGHVVKAWAKKDEMRGHRPCLRGLSELQRLYSPERPHYPMKRVGERGSGEWERISWDEAIGTIAETLKRVAEEDGPAANAFIAGSGNCGMLNAPAGGLMGRVLKTLGLSRIDQCVDQAKNVGAQRVFGGSGYDQPGSVEDDGELKNADTIFVWCSNISESYIQRWRALMDAKDSGVRIVVLNPNAVTVALKADEWVQVRPGTDPALALAMVKTIIDENLHDEEFLRQWSVAPYLVREDTGEFLRMSALGVAPTEGPSNPQTGKPTVIDKPVVWDASKDEHVPEGDTAEPAMTGSWEIGGIKVRTAFDLFMDKIHEYDPETVSEIVDVDAEKIRELGRLAATGNVMHVIGLGSQAFDNGVHIGSTVSVLTAVTHMIGRSGAGWMGFSFQGPFNAKFSNPTNAKSSSIPYLSLAEIMETGKYNGKDQPLRTIISAGCGFLGGYPDPTALKQKVIDKLDLFVVTDVAMTDGARYADIVLPAAHYYEMEDICTTSMNRVLFYAQRAVEPLFECKPDSEIARLLGRAMGLEQYVGESNEDYFKQLLDLPMYQQAGITLERLREEKAMRFAPKSQRFNDNNEYKTPSKKIEIYAEKPKPRVDFGQEFDVDAERLPRFFPPREAWPDRDIMKKYPLIMTSVRARNRWHTQGFEKPWLLELMSEPTLYVNPADAEARGIASGDYAEVFNDRGHAVARLVHDPGIRPGMLVYPKGWQAHQYLSGSFSDILSAEYDPVAVNSSFFDNVVEMRAWHKEA